MSKTTETTTLEKELDRVLETLLRESHGSRCTLRMDDAARGWEVDLVCAEAIEPGVKSLREVGSIDQRAAETVKWLAKEKRNLVQPDLTQNPSPPPPPALMSAYAAKAQMLRPLLARDEHLAGWISVHYVGGVHAFTAGELSALDRAADHVGRLVGMGA